VALQIHRLWLSTKGFVYMVVGKQRWVPGGSTAAQRVGRRQKDSNH
jgi:hypothetical protein